MQKTTINHNAYLVVQVTSMHVEFGLLQDNVLLDVHAMDKHLACRQFLIALQTMLTHSGLALEQIKFIAASVGPAPITTLRAILATLNGIHLSTGIPLIGIDGLQALINTIEKPTPINIAFANAYNNDLFYAISKNGSIVERGWEHYRDLLQQLMPYNTRETTIIASGIEPLIAEVAATFCNAMIIEEDHAPIDTVATLAVQEARAQHWQEQLLPLYVKQHQYKASITAT